MPLVILLTFMFALLLGAFWLVSMTLALDLHKDGHPVPATLLLLGAPLGGFAASYIFFEFGLRGLT